MNLLHRAVAGTLPFLPRPLVRVFARPYIAGETVEDLFETAGELAGRGYHIAISQLGEFVEDRAEAEAATAVYREVLAGIESRSLPAYVHVKVTQLGLLVDYGFCRDQIASILDCARQHGGTFVRMDMEDSPRIEPTLQLYRDLRTEFGNLGVVIQARMKRSLDDVRELAAMRVNVRLCKGVYIEPPEVAWTGRQEIRDSYLTLLRELLSAGCPVGIATHDDWLIARATRMIEELRVPPNGCEFQMLHGVRPQLREAVRREGRRVRIGVPFGADWLPYSLRRLKKNPEIAWLVARAVFLRKG